MKKIHNEKAPYVNKHIKFSVVPYFHTYTLMMVNSDVSINKIISAKYFEINSEK